MTGVVKDLRETFGFIRSEIGTNFYFHRADTVGSAIAFENLVVGDTVIFEPTDPPHPKGLRAIDVAWIRPPESQSGGS